MKKLIELKLKFLAKLVLNKYRPKIIGVSGSVGKTTTKEAIFAVLKKRYNTRRNIKNYNNELGLPLTILGCGSPGRNIFGWFLVFWKGFKLLLSTDRNYPEVLVLEMAVDHPGDMDYLTSIVRCDIAVVTVIGSVHVEYFGTVEKLREEKSIIVKKLSKEGTAVLNYDNEQTRNMKNVSKAGILTYGLDEKADVRASDIAYNITEGGSAAAAESIKGMRFKLEYRGESQDVRLPEVLGSGIIYNVLAAAAVGLAMGLDLPEIKEALSDFKPPRGRMNVISGIKHTAIIDDTYNAEPRSTVAALRAMQMFKTLKGRRLAALGDMLELGRLSRESHIEIGKIAAQAGLDKLFLVGEKALDIGRGAREAGMSRDDIFNFSDSAAAGRFIQNRLLKDDIILIKGSQGMRMEKITKEIMSEPLRDKELLVRQDEEWLKKDKGL